MNFKLEIAKMLDHSLLKPTMNTKYLAFGCLEAVDLEVASVCILPYYLRECVSVLKGTHIIPSTVIGFPHGATGIDVKIAELDEALKNGAKEVDAVINISKVLSNDFEYIKQEITWLTVKTHAAGAKIKIIFETCYLAQNDIIRLCKMCSDIGVDWIKTSTGFGNKGATIADVQLMMQHKSGAVQVKASGGIKTLKEVLEYKKLGVTRIGTSNSAFILEEAERKNIGKTTPY